MNQNPAQLARDTIDAALLCSGWVIQEKSNINLAAALDIAVKEYQTDVGPADYVLFVNRKPAGIIEAKREEEGHRLTMHEDQSGDYAKAQLKYCNNAPLPFVYEITGQVTRFTNYQEPKPRSRPVFSFHRPETFQQWMNQAKLLRAALFDIPELPKLQFPNGARNHNGQLNVVKGLWAQ